MEKLASSTRRSRAGSVAPPPHAGRDRAGLAPPSAPPTSTSVLPIAGTALLVILLILSLSLSSSLRASLSAELGSRLVVAAELTRDAVERATPRNGGALAQGLFARLEEIRRATSVTEIYLYDENGTLLAGSTQDGVIAPPRVRIASRPRPGERIDVSARAPERDASQGLTLLAPLAQGTTVGAILVRIDESAQGGLPGIDLVFRIAKVIVGIVIAAGLLILMRWIATGPPEAVTTPAATPASDVDLVLGTMKEVVSTLKDSETDYRDRWTAASRDAERWRRTNDLILESISSGILAFDSAERITMFNRAASSILDVGARAVLGRRVAEVFPPGDPVTSIARDLLEGRTVTRFETERSGPAGDPRWLGISSSVIREAGGERVGGILLVSDLTETKRLQEQTGLADRLRAVGEMSAGIAHEIKNSLHSLMGLANLLREDFPDESPPMAVTGILSEVETLEAMVKGVLEFSKPSLLVKASSDVSALLGDVVDSVRDPAARAGVDVRLELAPDLRPSWIDAAAVRRTFLNLALNAVEAMDTGGTLTIGTRPAEIPVMGEAQASGTPAIRIAFRDTGPGIREGDQARIFTPFYSTKRDGSGLGLALSHKTVTDHDGRLYLHSRVGVGTEFVILLPLEERRC